MRVLLVAHTYANPSHWDKLEALGRLTELAVVSPRSWPGDLDSGTPAPPPAHDAPYVHHRLGAALCGWEYRYVYHPRQLAQVLRSWRPDLVHVEQAPESLSLLQLALLKRRHRYRLTFFTWENVNALRRGAPIRQLNFRAADAAVAGNAGALNRCRRLGFREPMDVIPMYGAGLRPRAQRAPHTPFVVGFAGRLDASKGMATLLEAVRRQSELTLLVAGDGPLTEHVRREPRASSLGVVPRSAMGQFFDRVDVLVLPSLTTRRWAEQFGRVLIEAMAAGVPVIGSSSGAIPEVVGDAGLIFPEGDATALAAAIRRVRDDPRLRLKLIDKGLKRAARLYSNYVISARLAEFFARVLEPRLA